MAFSGTDIPSAVVKLATQSHYVHVAIVLSVNSDSSGNNDGNDPVLIAESHIDASLPSLGTGESIRGVQVQRLSERLASYRGPAWWASLKTPLDDRGLAQMQRWLQELESHQVPYDFLQAIGAGVSALNWLDWENQEDYSTLFCSELVTRALQIAGAIDECINPSEQVPVNVMNFSCLNQPVLIKQE